MVPLAGLRELCPMNSSFFPGCVYMKRKIGAQIGEFLPAVARHLAKQRAFAVHDLIVAKAAG